MAIAHVLGTWLRLLREPLLPPAIARRILDQPLSTEHLELLPLANKIAVLLKARDETITVAESSAGGLISAALLAVPGASAYFLGGSVVYTRKAREGLLGLSEADVKGMRSSTEPYTLALARAARGRVGANWALGETGAAGPSGNRYGDDAGHACFAVVGPVERSLTLETGEADRLGNMQAFAARALELLADCIATAPKRGG